MSGYDHHGSIRTKDAVEYFKRFYSKRIQYGLVAEKENSIFCSLSCSDHEIEKNIVANPIAALLHSGLFVYTDGTLSVKQPLKDTESLIRACYNRIDKYYRHIDVMPKIICFHKPEEDYGYLSNWYQASFIADGQKFSSAEQYLMYNKAMLFGDLRISYEILKTENVARIQQLGRMIDNYSDTFWSANRQIVAYRANLEKFKQNKPLQDMLVSTGNCILAECSASDKIWGTGLSMFDNHRQNMDFWNGKNLLGYTLMQVRNELVS